MGDADLLRLTFVSLLVAGASIASIVTVFILTRNIDPERFNATIAGLGLIAAMAIAVATFFLAWRTHSLASVTAALSGATREMVVETRNMAVATSGLLDIERERRFDEQAAHIEVLDGDWQLGGPHLYNGGGGTASAVEVALGMSLDLGPTLMARTASWRFENVGTGSFDPAREPNKGPINFPMSAAEGDLQDALATAATDNAWVASVSWTDARGQHESGWRKVPARLVR